MTWFKQREVVAVLLEELQRPERWELNDGEYRLIHKNGVELWVSNGVDYLKIEKPTLPKRQQLTWWECRKLWPEVRKVMRRFQDASGNRAIDRVVELLRQP